jgi:hypothetical protein
MFESMLQAYVVKSISATYPQKNTLPFVAKFLPLFPTRKREKNCSKVVNFFDEKL